MAQFGLVWAAYLGVAAGLVAAAQALTSGILRSMLGVSSLGQVDLSTNLPTSIADAALATVLGVLSLLVVIPAGFFLMLIMLVREAALILLVATSPISAAGLVSDTGKTWFWKTLRWFFSCLLIEPVAALILGLAVKLSQGVFHPAAPGGTDAPTGAAAVASHAGMAVVACVLIMIAAVCPLVIFRLLAFVDPSTASGAALRSSLSDNGGIGGLLAGGGASTSSVAGSGAAAASGGDGRSGGEAAAEKASGGRLAGALAMAGGAASGYGAGVMAAMKLANRAVDLGADVLGAAGVGHPSYSLDPRRRTRHPHPGRRTRCWRRSPHPDPRLRRGRRPGVRIGWVADRASYPRSQQPGRTAGRRPSRSVWLRRGWCRHDRASDAGAVRVVGGGPARPGRRADPARLGGSPGRRPAGGGGGRRPALRHGRRVAARMGGADRAGRRPRAGSPGRPLAGRLPPAGGRRGDRMVAVAVAGRHRPHR